MRATLPECVVYKKVGEEMVLLDFDRGVYYGLNPVGARVWELLAEGKTSEEILDHLTEEFEVARTDVTRDVAELMDNLQTNGLVRLE
jgi:hypothetical protein